MWNRLVMPPIHYRVRMEVGGEGTSAKEANIGREWLYTVDKTVNVGVAVGLRLCFMVRSIKK